MTPNQRGGGKLPGKTEYAGRRRAMTRNSGFSVHKDTTGGEFQRLNVKTVLLQPKEVIDVDFRLNGHATGNLLAYGLWFWHSPGVTVTITGGPLKRTLSQYGANSWNKAGSMWKAATADQTDIKVTFAATTEASVAIYEPICGRVRHKYLDTAREALLQNMFDFAPEAIFLDGEIDADTIVVLPKDAPTGEHPLIIKSCNRCGRYLPVNVPVERNQLSFTNHCVAEHRRPCKHATFGRLRNVEDPTDILQLDYGFQLECRFCKKFEVNAAHNPQRSSAQMKEDGARRRAFELLLEVLCGCSPQLRYRLENGSELADDIWNRFNHACFNCGTELATAKSMHLDHTRPLALLWPLDGTATALCKSCNSLKRDRPPNAFYTAEKLIELSAITGIPITDLISDSPNEEAIRLLMDRRDWLFNELLARDEMTKERDGKITGELVVKALQKVLARSADHKNINLLAEYEQHRIQTE